MRDFKTSSYTPHVEINSSEIFYSHIENDSVRLLDAIDPIQLPQSPFDTVPTRDPDAHIITMMQKIRSFIKLFVWHLPKFFVWSVPKHFVYGVGGVVRAGKWIWEGVKEISEAMIKETGKELWKFGTQTLPRWIKDSLPSAQQNPSSQGIM
jgi:hypothetical protein